MSDEEFYKLIAERRELIEAFLDGKQCQAKEIGIKLEAAWFDLGAHNFTMLFDADMEIRLKPQSKLVPWTFETVPFGVFWVRRKHAKDHTPPRLVTAINLERLYVLDHGTSFQTALDDLEWSHDRVAWHPCGTEVGG